MRSSKNKPSTGNCFWLRCFNVPDCCKGCSVCRMSQLEMPGASSLLDLRMPEDETRHTHLKTLVQYLNWTYGVIWKVSPGDR
jgi:hypothetical protein